jgi:hypothetical protein
MGPEQVFEFSELASLFGTCRIMGCVTCGLWNPFAAAPERNSALPGPRIPLRIRIRPLRFAHRTAAEPARRRCRPEQEPTMQIVPFDAPIPG